MLYGISFSGEKYGELDLALYDSSSKKLLTIAECLNIAGADKSNWNKHLKKLIENYNPNGLKTLFLISYADCDKERFLEVWREFSKHTREFSPAGYTLRRSMSRNTNADFIKYAECTYAKNGAETTVYCVFVLMG